MSRLSFLIGLFLSVTITGIVLLLSVLSNTPIAIMLPRCIVVFFLFGLLGVVLGSALEVLVMPEIVDAEIANINKRLKSQDGENTLSELGDLLEIKSDNQEEINKTTKEDETTIKADIGDLL